MSQFYDLASLVVIPSGYKASTIYAQKPLTTDGQLSFTRASTATRVNASGLIEAVASNVPRLDYLGSTCPRLNLEPQRTNLVTYSEQFDNAVYTKTNTTITANAIVSPDGNSNADALLESAVNSTHQIWQRPSITSGQAYTFSAFVKTNGRRRVQLQSFDNASIYAGAIYDVVSGSVVATNATASIQNYGSGWYRLILTATSPTTATGYAVLNLATDSFSSATLQDSYAGDTSKGVYVYGYQMEAGAYATSYIPTTTASITRVADVASKTGISSLIGQTEGTLFVEAANLFLSGSRTIALLYTSGSAYYQIYINSSNQVRVDVNGSLVFLGGSIAANTTYKIAFAYKSGEYALYINGTQIATSTSTTVPSSLTDYYLGNSIGSEQSGAYSQALLFKTRLTNAQLAELTAL
jgi:hypothetical protein